MTTDKLTCLHVLALTAVCRIDINLLKFFFGYDSLVRLIKPMSLKLCKFALSLTKRLQMVARQELLDDSRDKID